MIIARLIDDKGNAATFALEDADVCPPRYCVRRGQVWSWIPDDTPLRDGDGAIIATYRRTSSADLSMLDPLTVTLADKQEAA